MDNILLKRYKKAFMKKYLGAGINIKIDNDIVNSNFDLIIYSHG